MSKMLKKILRGGLPRLVARVGLLAASSSVLLWLAAAGLGHNPGLLDSVSGALSPSTLIASALGTQLTPAQQAQASGALRQALGVPAVQAAISTGKQTADRTLEKRLSTTDPSLARQLADHPVSIATLRKTLSGLPGQLRIDSRWLALAALTLVGVAFAASHRREQVLRRGARWALTTGVLGLAFGMLVPYVVSRVLHHGESARLAQGLAGGVYASAGGLFITLAVAGAVGLVICLVWRQAGTKTPNHVPRRRPGNQWWANRMVTRASD